MAPPVSDQTAWANWLRQQLAHAERENKGDLGRTSASRPAAVLIPLVPYADGARIIMTERSAHLRNHPGQISFPGGRAEPDDSDAAATALREAQEEIGLDASRVTVLGELGTYNTITNFRVTPVVGMVQPGCSLHPQLDEVAAILELPWSVLLNPGCYYWRCIDRLGERGKRLFVECGDVTVWGATVGMLLMLARALGIAEQPVNGEACSTCPSRHSTRCFPDMT